MRPVGPDDGVVAVFVGAQDRMRVVVLAGQQAVQVGRVGGRRCGLVSWLVRVISVTPYAVALSRWSAGICGMFSTWATALAGSMRT